MKTYKVIFLHTDGDFREVSVEAFDKERAILRFAVNWGFDMKLLCVYSKPIFKKN